MYSSIIYERYFFNRINLYNKEVMFVAKFENIDVKLSEWTILIDLININKKERYYITKVKFLFGEKMPKQLLKNGSKFQIFHVMYNIGYGILE